MAEHGGEQYKKQEGDHQTDEHVQNQLHSTTAGHGSKEGKQGVVEKIKEKLPGGDHGADEKKADEHTPYATNTVGDGYGNAGEEGHEKKGLMDKIKDMLPGGDHGADEKKADEHTPYATNTVGDGYGNAGEEGHEKKGLMDKIKDMLPGGGHGSEEHKTQATASTVGGGEHGDVGEEEHEKLMDQIKDTVAKTV